jgi:hypothetical protein
MISFRSVVLLLLLLQQNEFQSSLIIAARTVKAQQQLHSYFGIVVTRGADRPTTTDDYYTPQKLKDNNIFEIELRFLLSQEKKDNVIFFSVFSISWWCHVKFRGCCNLTTTSGKHVVKYSQSPR